MKIYIASSWKNSSWLLSIASLFRSWGHEVDLFCDESSKRFVFCFSQIDNYETLTQQTALQEPMFQKAFCEDRKWIDWCDVVVMILPCGNSAHLEAGYAKGAGKRLYIVGDFQPGEFDVMYGFANTLVDLDSIEDLRTLFEGDNHG